MEPSGRLHHASSETTLIIARRSRSELIAPFIPFFKSPLCACTSFAILSKRASHRRAFAYVSTQPESLPWDQAQVRKTPAEKNVPPIFFQTCLEAYVLPRTALELTVAIFPLIARWNRFERIPVLAYPTLFHPVQPVNP